MIVYCKYCSKELKTDSEFCDDFCRASMTYAKHHYRFFRRYECTDRDFFEGVVDLFWKDAIEKGISHRYITCNKTYVEAEGRFIIEFWILKSSSFIENNFSGIKSSKN